MPFLLQNNILNSDEKTLKTDHFLAFSQHAAHLLAPLKWSVSCESLPPARFHVQSSWSYISSNITSRSAADRSNLYRSARGFPDQHTDCMIICPAAGLCRAPLLWSQTASLWSGMVTALLQSHFRILHLESQILTLVIWCEGVTDRSITDSSRNSKERGEETPRGCCFTE